MFCAEQEPYLQIKTNLLGTKYFFASWTIILYNER